MEVPLFGPVARSGAGAKWAPAWAIDDANASGASRPLGGGEDETDRVRAGDSAEKPRTRTADGRTGTGSRRRFGAWLSTFTLAITE